MFRRFWVIHYFVKYSNIRRKAPYFGICEPSRSKSDQRNKNKKIKRIYIENAFAACMLYLHDSPQSGWRGRGRDIRHAAKIETTGWIYHMGKADDDSYTNAEYLWVPVLMWKIGIVVAEWGGYRYLALENIMRCSWWLLLVNCGDAFVVSKSLKRGCHFPVSLGNKSLFIYIRWALEYGLR